MGVSPMQCTHVRACVDSDRVKSNSAEVLMLWGYNTNGFAHHRLEDALVLLHELGYRSVALTLDQHALNPYAPGLPAQLAWVKQFLQTHQMRCVIETGARFLLDMRLKHQPTLLTRDETRRAQRSDFIRRAIDIAQALQADAVSFWSGSTLEPESATTLLTRLVAECQTLSAYAAERGVRLAFEPEPGMFIDTMPKFAELHQQVAHPNFGLTLDLGHLHCLGEVPIEEHLRAWHSCLWNIHLEDMKQGVHEHLMFGEGEMDYVPILRTLRELDYRFGLHVELSRHSHDAVRTARAALAYLRAR